MVCRQSGDLKRAIPEETKKLEKYPKNFQCPIAVGNCASSNSGWISFDGGVTF
jgi:hypothetical protein